MEKRIIRQFLVLGLLCCGPQLSAQSPFNSTSMCFDGVDDYVRVPYDSSFPTRNFTAAAWVKASFPVGNSAVIISRGDDDVTDNLPWDLRVATDGRFVASIENDADVSASYPSISVVADGSWHHVAATKSSTNVVEIYVDGNREAFYPNSLTPSENNFQDISIGCVIGSVTPPPPQIPIFFLQGGIDEVAMWNRALTPGEIQNLLQFGVPASSSGLRGYWSFDSNIGQLVRDASGFSNDGSFGDSSAVEASDPDEMLPLVAREFIRAGLPANPLALLGGQTSRPIIGNVWDPVIDHSSFLPAAVLDVFGLSALPANIPSASLGTILCGPTFLLRFRAPGNRLNLMIPNDCQFLGVTICVSGGSFDSAGNLFLTNAIDITIGNY